MRRNWRRVGAFEGYGKYEHYILQQSPDRIIVPYLSCQVPAVIDALGTCAVDLVSAPIRVSAQSSSRTVTLPTELGFLFHLKMALNCTIPARRRTMSGAARGGK